MTPVTWFALGKVRHTSQRSQKLCFSFTSTEICRFISVTLYVVNVYRQPSILMLLGIQKVSTKRKYGQLVYEKHEKLFWINSLFLGGKITKFWKFSLTLIKMSQITVFCLTVAIMNELMLFSMENVFSRFMPNFESPRFCGKSWSSFFSNVVLCSFVLILF